jgi:NAD(P)-dependent dehydrogenase (short-subunit alcohol dehydrogenase family)
MSSTDALLAGRAWSIDEMPDQTGRTVLVTGPTVGGLGHHTALELARRGARVILAGRNPERLRETRAAIGGDVAGAEVETLQVDLSDLGSVRHAAGAAARFGAIDVLVNNAGVMGTPHTRTADGLELQMATNHFGPFLLTGLLLPQLAESADGRVVAVASHMHRLAWHPPLEDPKRPHGRYAKWRVYGQSKLANLYFTSELDRRCRQAEIPVRALAAHPGFAGTHLAANGQYGRSSGGVASVLDGAIRMLSQSAAAGALPTLMAATMELPGDTFCGPSGPAQFGGSPKVVGRTRLARDRAAAAALWELSERTVGLSYP